MPAKPRGKSSDKALIGTVKRSSVVSGSAKALILTTGRNPQPGSIAGTLLTDERHVRNAIARFDQVVDVTDGDRALAFGNIEKAAKYYDVDLSETNWHELGVHPQLHRKEAAAKGVETRRERGELKEAAARAVETKRKSGALKEEAAKAAATRKREQRGR